MKYLLVSVLFLAACTSTPEVPLSPSEQFKQEVLNETSGVNARSLVSQFDSTAMYTDLYPAVCGTLASGATLSQVTEQMRDAYQVQLKTDTQTASNISEAFMNTVTKRGCP